MADHHIPRGILDAQPGLSSNGRLKVDPLVAFQVIAWLVAALITYGAMNSRVAVVESQQNAAERRMERIENKIDDILGRLR